jgi:hypothetical protein
LTNCSSATRRSVPGELPEQRVEVRAEGAAPPGPARTSRPSVADCRRSSIRHANLATPQRLRLSEACAPAARPSRDRLLGAEQKRAAAAAMVMQGICAAPRGIALRNTFINSIWETPSINNPLPRDYPPPQNTGHKSVARPRPSRPQHSTMRLRPMKSYRVTAVLCTSVTKPVEQARRIACQSFHSLAWLACSARLALQRALQAPRSALRGRQLRAALDPGAPGGSPLVGVQRLFVDWRSCARAKVGLLNRLRG